jgi:hypothetical protein
LLRSEVAGVKLRRLPKGMEGEAFTTKMPSRCVIGGTVWAIHKVRGRAGFSTAGPPRPRPD